jgi:hypothetical protein
MLRPIREFCAEVVNAEMLNCRRSMASLRHHERDGLWSPSRISSFVNHSVTPCRPFRERLFGLTNYFHSKRRMDLIENCWEAGLFAVRNLARYERANHLAVLYCLSKKKLRSHDLQHVDLSEIATTAGRPRFLAQSAWMVGPIESALSADCITSSPDFSRYLGCGPSSTG